MKYGAVLLLMAALLLPAAGCGHEAQSPEETGEPPVIVEEISEEPSGTTAEEEALRQREEQLAAIAVSAAYAEDVPEEERNSFQETPTDYDQGVVFRARKPVQEFRFFVVEWADEAGGWGPLEGEALYTQAELTPDRELLVVTSFPGDMPSRGISYEEDGVRRAYTLSVSGLDGALLLQPIE